MIIRLSSVPRVLSPYQCGFRKCHSTEWTLCASWIQSEGTNDQGQLTGAVFINLRKAFDTVNHKVLLSNLRGLGVMHREDEWFRNYLHNRTQVMEFQGVPSPADPVSVVVSQGSILGPLFFILYLNDLPSAVVECSVHHVRRRYCPIFLSSLSVYYRGYLSEGDSSH